MDKKELAKQLMDEIGKLDPERLEAYMHMFDRMLLYTLAANLAPKEALLDTLGLCDKLVKMGINVESQYRTNFLESTPQGRLAKLQNEPDGESVRLDNNKAWNLAKKIITANLDSFGQGEGQEFESEPEF